MLVNSKKFKVKRKFGDDIETEEILMDSQRLKQSPDSEREKLEKPIKENVLRIFFILIVVVLALLLAKSFHLQIIKGSYWRALAEGNRLRSYPIEPLRGVIFDKNKIPLAINVPKLDLLVIPMDLAKDENYKEIIIKLSRLLEMPEADLENKIKERVSLTYPVIIAEDLSNEKAIAIESEFADVPEVKIQKNSRRQYADGPIFAHILGYLGKVSSEEISQKNYFIDDVVGRTGLEEFYQDSLRGTYGAELAEIDSLGRTQKTLAAKEPIAGKNLVLSIDAGLQEALYQSLKSKLSTLNTSRAAAVAMNPQNGKILALVSFPSFDNNNLIKGDAEYVKKLFQDKNFPLINRAISGGYPSGSTIKPLLASAALEEKVITATKTINCPGQISLYDKYHQNVYWIFNDWKAHGTVDMIKALAESCDVYFYTLGGGYGDIEGLGIERIKKYLEIFGWGEKTGIDLPGEKSGFIPDANWKKQSKNQDWFVGDTYNVSIGQGDIVINPLQLTFAIAAIANNGKLFQPQLVQETEPKIIRENFIEKDYLEIVRKGMREAVVSGTAKILNDLPVKAAAKTGTAQVSKTKAPHAWFTAFAPYENPEIVVTILIENGGEGSTNAAPIAKDILAWYFQNEVLTPQ